MTVDPHDSRVFCECCGYPTLRVPLGDIELEFDFAQRACPLCEWESPRLTEAGAPVPNGPSAEERNDGHSLAEARASLANHLSMYDPAKHQHAAGREHGKPRYFFSGGASSRSSDCARHCARSYFIPCS
jgi:hypothetical protein